MTTAQGWFPIEVQDGPATRRGEGSQRRHRVRIMTDVVARDGDVVEPMGMNVENYLKNPVVMWVHDYVGRTPSGGLPIGRTLSLHRRPQAIDVEFEFLPGDAFANRVANAWERGFLRTASIGWESLEATPLPNRRGLRHRKSDLLEWSLVPIPADPAASRELYAAGMRSMGFGDLLGKGPSTGALPPAARVDHPSLTQLVAELEDAWDYVKSRLGPAGPTSPRLLQPLTRMARELGAAVAQGQPVSDECFVDDDKRENGDDTADNERLGALVRAAREFRGLVEEMRTHPDARELAQALNAVPGLSK